MMVRPPRTAVLVLGMVAAMMLMVALLPRSLSPSGAGGDGILQSWVMPSTIQLVRDAPGSVARDDEDDEDDEDKGGEQEEQRAVDNGDGAAEPARSASSAAITRENPAQREGGAPKVSPVAAPTASPRENRDVTPGLPRVENQVSPDGFVQLPDLVRVEKNVNVYLFDAVFVPRHSYIAMTSLLEWGAKSRTGEFVVDWYYPGAPNETLKAPCDVLQKPVIELADGELVELGACDRVAPLGGNFGGFTKVSFSHFKVPPEGLTKILRFAQTEGPKASMRLRLTESTSVAISLSSRSAGLLRNTTRAPADLGDEESFSNPFGNSLSRNEATIAVCLKQLVSPTPYIHEILLYYKRLGVSHVYLGVRGDELVQFLHERVGWFIASGFLSLARMDDTPGMRVESGKPIFLYSCLHHAKQFDTFVAAWDVDEVPIVTDTRLRGKRPNLARYLYDETLSGNVTVGKLDHAELWNPPKGNNSHPVPYFCEWILQGSVAFPVTSDAYLEEQDRVGRLHEDFPLRSNIARYFDKPYYMKSIAVAANMHMLEIHKHTNCRVTDESGLRFASKKIMRQIPYDRRLYPDHRKITILHFANMYMNRYKASKPTSRSEFAQIMEGYQRVIDAGRVLPPV